MLGDDSLTAVINIDVPLDEVTARMKARGRADDTDEGIAQTTGALRFGDGSHHQLVRRSWSGGQRRRLGHRG